MKTQLNYNFINELTIKFPNNHPYNQSKLDSIKLNISNNKIATNPKLLIPIINTSISITGQYPTIITAKKSVASFKLRVDSPIGVQTTLRKHNALHFLTLLNYYYLPRVSSELKNNKINKNT
jgi:large subunit ribosomal protein L5